MGIDVILQYPPSVLAAAAYSLASYTVSKLLWVRLSSPLLMETMLALHGFIGLFCFVLFFASTA